jgi:hypothetical protein
MGREYAAWPWLNRAQGTQRAPKLDPQGRCVCGEKVTIADAQEVTLPNGRPGWQGYCPECGAPMFANSPQTDGQPSQQAEAACGAAARRPVLGVEAGTRPVARPAIAQPAYRPDLRFAREAAVSAYVEGFGHDLALRVRIAA